ncbi:MAG: hypothetical protein GY940_10375 [bacterium]|nr:hypothetical protein [bacterium]
MNKIPEFKYRGARALTIMHQEEMRRFVETWKEAKEAAVILPETKDPDYESLETLLIHVLRASRGYMTWMCEQLELPDPAIKPAPGVEEVETVVDEYLDHLLEQWKKPLTGVEAERFDLPTYKSRWNVHYCIDAMLEHAVMHPKRHRFQLEELMNQK